MQTLCIYTALSLVLLYHCLYEADGKYSIYFVISTNTHCKIIARKLKYWGRDKITAISQTTFPKSILMNKNVWILLEIYLKCVPKLRIDNITALVHIVAWRWPGDKPLSEAMMVSFLMYICLTWPQLVNKKSNFVIIENTFENGGYLFKAPIY